MLKSSALSPANSFVSPSALTLEITGASALAEAYLRPADATVLVAEGAEAWADTATAPVLSTNGSSAYLGCIVADGVVMGGAEVATLASLPTAEDCCRACHVEEGCNAWTWCSANANAGCRHAAGGGAAGAGQGAGAAGSELAAPPTAAPAECCCCPRPRCRLAATGISAPTWLWSRENVSRGGSRAGLLRARSCMPAPLTRRCLPPPPRLPAGMLQYQGIVAPGLGWPPATAGRADGFVGGSPLVSLAPEVPGYRRLVGTGLFGQPGYQCNGTLK